MASCEPRRQGLVPHDRVDANSTVTATVRSGSHTAWNAPCRHTSVASGRQAPQPFAGRYRFGPAPGMTDVTPPG